MPFISYKASKYSVPWDMCFTSVFIKAISDKLYIYDERRCHICTHQINPAKGSYNRLPEHEKEPSTQWMAIAGRMRK
jgi:hypothetical protein